MLCPIRYVPVWNSTGHEGLAAGGRVEAPAAAEHASTMS